MKNLYTVLDLIFVFESIQREYRTIKRSNFCHSALFCLDFLQAECHWRVNYVYAFTPLYFFSPPPPFSLSPDVCERANARLCVFANERVQALFFFWTSLWCCCLFIYFSACEGPFSAVRATADWARVALSAIHQRGASLTDEPVTSAPYSTSAWSWSCARGFLFLRRRSVTRRASASSPPCLAEYQCASHVKQLFHLWPGGIALLWFLDDNGALALGVLFTADLIPVLSLLHLWVSVWRCYGWGQSDWQQGFIIKFKGPPDGRS